MTKKRQYSKLFKIAIILAVWLLPITIYLFLFLVFEDKPLHDAIAVYGSVNVSVTVVPDDPVGKVSPIQIVVKSHPDRIRPSDLKVFTAVEGSGDEAAERENVEASPVTNFHGMVTYPYSKVVLEFTSVPFFVTLESDAYGGWSWTNYGSPLEPGKHPVLVYAFTPNDLLVQRSVFIEKHVFSVVETEAGKSPTILDFNKDTLSALSGVDVDESQFSQDSQNGFFLFNMEFNNGIRYYRAGEEFTLEYAIESVQQNVQAEATLEHELYTMNDNGSQSVLIGSYDDDSVKVNNFFEKKFKLKSSVAPGTYLIKSTSRIAGNEYIQNQVFKIEPDIVGAVGAASGIDFKFRRTLLWNLLFAITVMIIILTFVALELNRLISTPPIDEDTLRFKRLIKNS